MNIMKKNILSFDEIVSKVAALGVPGLILVIAMGATGFAGAAAITTALAAIGPGGIVGGLVILGIVGIVTEALTKYGYKAIVKGVLKELVKRGETKETILNKIEKYHISKSLKLQLKEEVNKLFEDE